MNYANTSQKKARVTTSISDFILFFTFWPYGMACGILFPWPGIKVAPATLETWSLNHWTTR